MPQVAHLVPRTHPSQPKEAIAGLGLAAGKMCVNMQTLTRLYVLTSATAFTSNL